MAKNIVSLFILIFSFFFFSSANALVGSCTFNVQHNSNFKCPVTTTGSNIFYSFQYHPFSIDGIDGLSSVQMQTISVKTSTGFNIIHYNRAGFAYTGTVHYFDGLVIGETGPKGATGSVGPQGATGSVGLTGATGSFIYYTGAIRGSFDTLQASYELPQWNLVLHLSSPAVVSANEDIEITGTGFFIINSVPISDPNDPRIILTVKNTSSGTGVECGWYDVIIPPSLLQGIYHEQANPDAITTKFEIHGCEGYKTSAPPVYMLESKETPFVPPSASGSYFAITYKDSLTGATYIDFWSLAYLLVFTSGILTLFYSLYRIFVRALTGKW